MQSYRTFKCHVRLPLITVWQFSTKALTWVALSMAKLYCCLLISIQVFAVLRVNTVLREMWLQSSSPVQILVVKLAINKISGNKYFKLE